MYSGDELYSDDITSGILTGKSICRTCGRSTRHVEDGSCPRCCNPEKADEETRAANRRAWRRRRETGLAFPGGSR